ncbi:MAG TPA: Na-translocating system protein MpsC family protein [Baekduia sp.]|nr:Na-translocating system protein MpsC family protein [Baekduia sp.]
MSQSIEPEHPVDRGSVRSAVANAIVRLHAEHYGRGPTRARAHVADDHVLVILEDVFTTAERTLIGAGHGDRVQASREAFNLALRERFTEAVETIIGRRVRAVLCQTHLDPEMAIQVFALEPSEIA